MSVRRLFLVAIALRVIASFTNIATGHPDEWYQTVEFGNFLGLGFASQSGEMLFHLRNLTWPLILSLPLRLSALISPGNPLYALTLVKLTTALFDFSMLWAIWKFLCSERRVPDSWRPWIFALFVLPWFHVADSVRPSQEHLSAIALWWSLAFISSGESASPRRSRWLFPALAGFCAILTGTFRYPSLLFGVGICLAIGLRSVRGNGRGLLPFSFGIAGGLAAGGLADWIIYGRPWESFWMYSQYNVWTGLSAKNFGNQGPSVYWSYLSGCFGGVLLPLGLGMIVLVPIGMITGLAALEPWAFAAAAYVIGHLLIGHKEPRFMNPLPFLLIWATVRGLLALRPTAVFRGFLAKPPGVLKTGAVAVLLVVSFGNGIKVLRSAWGDTWRPISTFQELGRHLSAVPSTCAVITVRRPLGALLPWKDTRHVPEPALAFFPAPSHEPSSTFIASLPLVWVLHQPDCRPDSRVLVQPQRPESYWSSLGCELLPTGPLRYLPHRSWNYVVNRGWVSGPWYDCPSSVLPHFVKQQVRVTLRRTLLRLETLPRPGITAQEYLQWEKSVADQKSYEYRDATFGEW